MSISLLGSINVCKVNTGYANKIQSDRFENPDTMTCPLWNGQDSFGRYVHPDSFATKNAGCNSAEDRVAVENFLRPQYMEYVALDAAGFRSPNMFGNPEVVKEKFAAPGFQTQSGSRMTQENWDANPRQYVENWDANPHHNQIQLDAVQMQKDVQDVYKIVGSAGYQYRATNTPYDTGYNGVQGGGDLGCGRLPRTVENFTYQPSWTEWQTR